MMKRQLRRSWRKLERKLNDARTSTVNLFRSNSSYQTRTISSFPSSDRANSESDVDDQVFAGVDSDDESTVQNNDNQSEVSIPCEFCQQPFSNNELLSHQASCSERRRLRRTEPRGRSSRRLASDSGQSRVNLRPAPSAPVRERSPSPTEGFPVPEDLQCPITLALFRDPVVASDGHTYEREAILRVIDQNGRSPMTRVQLSRDALHPNLWAKRLVNDFRESCRKKREKYKYRLDVDLKKSDVVTSISTDRKKVYLIEWMKPQHAQNAVLIHFTGENAAKLADTLRQISLHPNLTRTYGQVENPRDEILIVQEYLPVQTLTDLLSKHEQLLSLPLIDMIFYQVSCALEHLHQSNIIYGHLTSDDVLIYQLDNFIDKNLIKLTNIAHYLICNDEFDASKSAPEVVSSHQYSLKSDIYSFGLLARMVYSSKPMINERDKLLSRCLADDPVDRPTIDEITAEFKAWINDQGLSSVE